MSRIDRLEQTIAENERAIRRAKLTARRLHDAAARARGMAAAMRYLARKGLGGR